MQQLEGFLDINVLILDNVTTSWYMKRALNRQIVGSNL